MTATKSNFEFTPEMKARLNAIVEEEVAKVELPDWANRAIGGAIANALADPIGN